jgi:hypothetical protein
MLGVTEEKQDIAFLRLISIRHFTTSDKLDEFNDNAQA